MGDWTRRHCLHLLGTGAVMVATGCTGSEALTDSTPGGTESASDRTASPTAPSTPTVQMEDFGRIARNEVEELAFLGWWSNVLPEENLFQIGSYLRNTGDRTTTVLAYDLQATVYDESNIELESDPYETTVGVNELAPGDAVTVTTGRTLENPNRVARYSLSLLCPAANEGIYCER